MSFIKSTRKIIGAGVNYKEILKLTNTAKSEHPVIFFKPISSLISSEIDENVVKIPKAFERVNFETELGVIIGKKCKNVSKEEAMSCVLGYCLALDMTGMDFIIDARPKGLPWCLGKGFDTSTPVSRFLKPEEIENPNDVRVWCKINGEMKQDDSTKNLIFSIPELISYTSNYMGLEEYDLILTGTPAGACPLYDGDVIECGLGDIVEMKYTVKNE